MEINTAMRVCGSGVREPIFGTMVQEHAKKWLKWLGKTLETFIKRHKIVFYKVW
jgi:hypothetical protein